MEFFEFVQKFFLILLPGIFGSYIYAAINIRKEQHYYLEILKMIVFSFASYAATDFIFGIIKSMFPCFIYAPLNIIHYVGTDKTEIPTANAATAIIVGIVLAGLLTKANNENWLFKLANRLKLSHRANNQCVWDIFYEKNSVVILRDYITQNTFFGHVAMVSDNSVNRELLLDDVDVYNEKSEFLYHTDQLYLSRAHNEFSVEIQNKSIEESDK